MKYKAKNIILKNGKPAILRPPKPEDAAEMVDYLKTACGESEYLANYPEEINYTVEGEKEYIKANLESGTNLMIVCETEGRIAGNCQIMLNRTEKTKHRAGIAIALLKDFWGLGIGRAMLKELTQFARSAGIEQLELEMVEGNHRAEALYRKCGFETVGIMPDAFRLRSGASAGCVYMRKKL